MNKHLRLILLFTVLIISNIIDVYATSGCCSSHGGVDCDYIQNSGKVVCNDGWRGSSCNYSSMAKCDSGTSFSNDTSNEVKDNDSNNYVQPSNISTENNDSFFEKISGIFWILIIALIIFGQTIADFYEENIKYKLSEILQTKIELKSPINNSRKFEKVNILDDDNFSYDDDTENNLDLIISVILIVVVPVIICLSLYFIMMP